MSAPHQPPPQPPSPAGWSPTPARRRRDVFPGFGVVLLVMAVGSMLCSAVPNAFTHSIFGDGEGEGDVGVLKLYVSRQIEGAFVALGLVLLLGALACFAVAFVRRARDTRA